MEGAGEVQEKKPKNVEKGKKLLLQSPLQCRPEQTDKTEAFSPVVEPGLAQVRLTELQGDRAGR